LRYLDKSAVAKMSPEVFARTVPFFLSQTGLGYRRDRLPDFVPSWTIYSNSALKGRMTLLNDMRDVMGAALITLGYSPNTRNPDEIQNAASLILEWKKNIAKFENEQYKNGIATAEFLVVQGFRGELLQVAEENNSVGFALPIEGSLLSYDLMAIPQGARQVELALAFINTLYLPEHAAKNMEKIFERMPNTGAYELLPPALRENPTLFPTEEEMARAFLIEDLGEDILLYRKAWEMIKESS
jgi:spermidine/putrescine transport system substrate-binding protein